GLLRAGVMTSAAFVFLGGLIYLIHFWRVRPDYGTFRQDRAEVHSVLQVLRSAAHLDGRALIQLGLLFLVATPVARVLLSVVAFWLQRDRLYVYVSAIVLAILLFS